MDTEEPVQASFGPNIATKVDGPSNVGGIAETDIANERYALGGMLGRGGMGEVLEAVDHQIGREVAVKRMRAEAPSEKQIARFLREARIQGRLEHPAIVPVHELGRDANGKPYFAMKKLQGRTLAELIKAGPSVAAERASSSMIGRGVPLQRMLRAIADVCLAVELAHQRGFVHRDLKPDNIVLGEYGETYVLDWGVAKVTGEDDSAFASVDATELVTAAGAAVGTPGYMAPEQAKALPDVDGRADVYSLGCIMFEVLVGERLHPVGPAGMKTAVAGIESRPSKRVKDRDIPPELDEIVVEATATDRTKRIQTARELGERIQQFLDGDRDHALRCELARHHLSTATAAFATQDRSTAMREAGRALALDPQLHAAGELITQMMIEPPPELPAEVVKAFEHESADVIRATLLANVVSAGFFALWVPLVLLFATPDQRIYAALMALLAVASISFQYLLAKGGRAFLIVPLLSVHILLVVVSSRMFTPLLMGPALAAVTAMGFMTGPQYRKRQATLVVVLCTLAVLGPLFAERVGWLSETIVAHDGGAWIRAPMLAGSEAGMWLMGFFTLSVVFSAVVLARGMKIAERGARQRMHLQAWQLRQLVSSS
ncbi:MAG: serine/threonine-protein kinase [Kofleriaceae bacterium]|nr:serine/threonine-protein kinase [Kofleriaceae bacterium]